MAVRAQHSQVFESIIVLYPVDVVEMHAERAAAPRVQIAYFATLLQKFRVKVEWPRFHGHAVSLQC